MRLLDPVSLICLSVLVVSGTSDTVLRFRSQQDLENGPAEEHAENSITKDGAYIPLQEYAVRNVCPNGVTQCSATTTCCLLRNGQYGCCEGISAVCCADGVHCCPEGFQCEMEKGQCSSGSLDLSIPWVDKKVVRAQPLASPHASINLTCPDRKTLCEQNDTCCNATVGYGCCPMPHAECCSDKLHCCPNNTKCDIVNQRCYKPGDQFWTMPWLGRRRLDSPKTDLPGGSHKRPKISQSFTALKKIMQSVPGGVTCNDGNMCPDGDTCCLLTDGSYGCCPYTDVLSGNKGDKNPGNGITCPDGKSTCPDGSTCCQLTDGTYGCCPKANATCCSDHVHCCASGCSCDVVTAYCKCPTEDSSSVPWTDSKAADAGNDVPCPGGTSECSDGQTCCQLKSGEWGCCPFPVAVCCEDHEHCCPQGFTCDVPHQKCARGNISISMTPKQPAKPMTPSNTDCPDGSQCPGAQTCCIDPSGAYLCCPLPEAECCSDKQHCCPQGYTCNLQQQTCDKGPVSVPLLTKTQSIARAKTVVCPDHKSECPDGSTCCDMGGRYGCCPIKNAVCCSDHQHCCPPGYTCDAAKGSCDKGVVTMPWETKMPAIVRKEEDITCPDGSSCPDGQTCCRTSSRDYGCCPQPDAVCCSDNRHCCPHGYTCDIPAGKCDKGSMSLPWSLKRPATPKPAGKVDTVVCPDGSYCPGLQTCCLQLSGRYGCCPFPLGVCCSDLVHCCPSGFICNTATGTCVRESASLPWEQYLPSIPAVNQDQVVCPDGSSCPDQQTCCQLLSGEYGCCPRPQAVCCSDHQHCCPNGYTCNVAASACVRGLESLPWESKRPSIPAGQVRDVECDDGSSCPDGQTCCELQSGEYGCCPYPEAVCCSDHLHCCPNGYTCNVAAGSCDMGSESIPWKSKQPSIPAGKVKIVTCPDDSTCDDGETCCQVATKEYGCCPLPEAECCSDLLHCCPNGYKCDVSGSACIKGTASLPWAVKKPSMRSLP